YNMDMPYTSPMCLGLALACPDERVVALEGDGSMLMALSGLTTIGRYQPENLTVIVFDNRVYLTTGSGTVPTAEVDFAGMARASASSSWTYCATGVRTCCSSSAGVALMAMGRSRRSPKRESGVTSSP